MDELRARAYLDLLLGTDSRPGLDGTPAPAPAGFAGRVMLTVPLATLAGLADRPGDLAGLGPVRLRAQHPVRGIRTHVPVQRGSEVPP